MTFAAGATESTSWFQKSNFDHLLSRPYSQTAGRSRQLVARYKQAKSQGTEDSNLVDSASSHTLVSKIKPCMSKYKSFTLKLRTAHYISYSLFDSPLLLGYP